jgi:GntR family transcriptional regulator
MPAVRRIEAPYVQIANHYRQLILDGVFTEGDRLPTVAEIGKEWNVSASTASRGIGQLDIEGFVRVLARGTFVEPLSRGADTPRGRMTRVRQSGRAAPETEMEMVRVAELIRVPVYVGELMDLDLSGDVIRRESVTIAGRKPKASPVALNVSWFAPQLAEAVPELLHTRRIPGGAIARIEVATGKLVTHGEDHLHGRASDAREASALGVPVGSPILAGAYLWTDSKGTVLEYGEFCLPERRTLRYDYEIETSRESDHS